MSARAWFGPAPDTYPVGSPDGDANRHRIRLPRGYEIERLYGDRCRFCHTVKPLQRFVYTERTFRDDGWLTRDELDDKIIVLLRWPGGSLLFRRP